MARRDQPHAIFTPSTTSCATSVRRFVDKELRPHVDEWEDAGYFPDDVFRRCGELGFLGLHYPERWGGSGGDLAAGLVFVEELARCGCGGDPDGDLGADPTWHARAGRVRHRRPARAVAAARDRRREDRRDRDHRARRRLRRRRRSRTRAVRDGDSWRDQRPEDVHHQRDRGRTSSPWSRRPSPAPATAGISLFIVDTALPGVSVSRQAEKLGMLSSDTAEIALDDVAVPARRPRSAANRARASRS